MHNQIILARNRIVNSELRNIQDVSLKVSEYLRPLMLFGIRAHLDSMFPVCYTTSSSPECTTVAAPNGKLQHWQHKEKTASPGQVLCHDLCQIAHFYQNYRNRPAPKRKKPQRVFLTGGRAAAGQTQKNQVISGKIASKRQKKNPQRREARQEFLWCTQQDSNLWPTA